MVERGAALSWYDEVYGEYRAAVVLNVALEMAEMAPVFPCVPNMVFYDDDYDSVTGKYNVRLRHCPKPFTQVCENAYGHSCFADASEDARMMRPVTYLESFATRSEWEPVLDEDIEEVLTLRRKEQKEQQKKRMLRRSLMERHHVRRLDRFCKTCVHGSMQRRNSLFRFRHRSVTMRTRKETANI